MGGKYQATPFRETCEKGEEKKEENARKGRQKIRTLSGIENVPRFFTSLRD